jgi:hypothetical protein
VQARRPHHVHVVSSSGGVGPGRTRVAGRPGRAQAWPHLRQPPRKARASPRPMLAFPRPARAPRADGLIPKMHGTRGACGAAWADDEHG